MRSNSIHQATSYQSNPSSGARGDRRDVTQRGLEAMPTEDDVTNVLSALH